MSFEGYIEKMKKIQNFLLQFLEDELDIEENYENLMKILSDHKITEDKHELKSFLRLVNAISSNHHRFANFIRKIERILLEIKKEIKNRFSNSEIFELFENNKRILLFLIKENIVKIDENIFTQMTKDEYVKFKYPQYFSPEIKPFLTEKFIEKYVKNHSDSNWIEEAIKEVPEDFDKKRLEGENDNILCELIRKQKVKEFIAYMNKEGLTYDGFIKESIFETNQFLLDHEEIKIIEYASFFGCMKIINFLEIVDINLMPSMWEYSIHGKNCELIHYLEDNQIVPVDKKHEITLKESIKCHHDAFTTYILKYLMNKEDLEFDKINDFNNNIYRYSIEYNNYRLFPDNVKYKYLFNYLCQFGYYTLVNLYLTNKNIDINAITIIILSN